MMDASIGGVVVSRETLDQLSAFEALVLKWTKKINLISASTVADIRTRHTVDSAQLLQFAPAHITHWMDLGSGGGFPGIVLAILAQSSHPDARFTFVESDQRKATFLRTAIRMFHLNATVLSDRIESVPSQTADVISARALASFSELLVLSARHLSAGGMMIFPKGRTGLDEIDAAKRDWHFDLRTAPSMTEDDAVILIVQGLARA